MGPALSPGAVGQEMAACAVLGGMLGADSDMILLLYNPATYEYADVIGTYLYRYGLMGGNFSYGTAVGFMISLINFGMVYLANMVSRKVADYSLW